MKEDTSSQAHLEAVIDSATDVVFTIDESSMIQFVSEAIEPIFGYTPAAVKGEVLTMLKPERYRARHLEAIEAYIDTKIRSVDWNEVEFPGLHRKGHEIPLSISFSEFVQGGERFLTSVFRDVSGKEKRKQALEDLNLATRNLMHVVSPIEIYDLAVQMAADLDAPILMMTRHDSTKSRQEAV